MVSRRVELTAAQSARASRTWWDANAAGYHAEHGEFLGDDRFVWCPEGVDEADAQLLGPVRGGGYWRSGAARRSARTLARGSGRGRGRVRHLGRAAPGRPGALDRRSGTTVRTVAADAEAVPFADQSFDLACSAFGGLPFVGDVGRALGEVYRVLRPGGRLVFSVTHPVRWAMPDDPSERGLRITASYFDRTPYVEVDAAETPVYVEHHRTLGDWVRALTGAGFVIEDLLEPRWPAGHDRVWGGATRNAAGWSPAPRSG